jgi:hypothetical protein
MAGRPVSLDLPVASILPNPRQDWHHLTAGHGRVRVARDITVDWGNFTPDNFLFTHCTIVSSVATAENGYYIEPACSELVNNNGNAWTNDVLLSTFRSFVGGENYLEHVQIPELSKGKILDAVLRPIIYKDKQGRESNVYYCDILVATSRKHGGLVTDIESGKLGTMSMGCLADYVTCSRCGQVLADNDPNCGHLNRELLQTFIDENGVARIVAELCGRMIDQDGNMVGDPNSVKFIEASWVDKPAFWGAVLNHFITEVPTAAQILSFPTPKLEETLENLFRLRVADRTGMIVLRVAREELLRRKRLEIAEEIVRTYR